MGLYGSLPKYLGHSSIHCDEMMFYQYLPIKFPHSSVIFEERLEVFKPLLTVIFDDFKSTYGLQRAWDSYIYLTVKKMYQPKGCSYNRHGWHSDGFLTDDINYVWCDNTPTVFNTSNFNLTPDDKISLREMDEQALEENNVVFPDGSLLRLDQYQIHKVGDNPELVLRTFVKVSFSTDKYDLKGNSVNHLLNYDWTPREREIERNIPQQINK